MRMLKTAVVDCEIEAQVIRRTGWYLVLVTTAAMVAMLILPNESFGQSGSSQASPTGSADKSGLSQSFQSPFQAGQGQKEAQNPWKFEGRLHLQKGTSEGYIVLQMDLDQGHYIYSVNPKGSPAPTKISVVANPTVQTRGAFAPNVNPEVNENDPVFRRRIEKHKGQVQFFVPCQVDANVDFQATGMPEIEFNGQVCSADGVCIPISGQKVAVKFAGFFERDNQSAAKTAAPASNGQQQTILDR